MNNQLLYEIITARASALSCSVVRPSIPVIASMLMEVPPDKIFSLDQRIYDFRKLYEQLLRADKVEEADKVYAYLEQLQREKESKKKE
jgi:hypothetical protein